jgi:hypothetical protein
MLQWGTKRSYPTPWLAPPLFAAVPLFEWRIRRRGAILGGIESSGSRSGGTCQDQARDGFLRLILVREVNSGLPDLPPWRDRLWVDFFGGPPPPLLSYLNPVRPGTFHGGLLRLRRRVCPGMEGVSEDHVPDYTVFDSSHREAKLRQDAGVFPVTGRRAWNKARPTGCRSIAPTSPKGCWVRAE